MSRLLYFKYTFKTCFASALLENFNCKVGVITSLLTLSQAFDNYVHFNKGYSSKSLKATENYN